MDVNSIYAHVTERYSATARASNDPKYGNAVATAFGYTAQELSSIPQEANLGLSCGNPLALANLKEGETVIDLGSGAGFDVFLSARRVGEKGRAIGVDMNEDMLRKARRNADKSGLQNVSFVSSKITDIFLPDSTADVIISNCVINLVPHSEKPQVFHEIFRLLNPGGRVAISDILIKKELTEQMKKDVALYVGCIAGASKKEDYKQWLNDAGFSDIFIVDTGSDLNIYNQTSEDGRVLGRMCCGSSSDESSCGEEGNKGSEVQIRTTCCGTGDNGSHVEDKDVIAAMKTNFGGVNLNDWAGSYKIFALKPSRK